MNQLSKNILYIDAQLLQTTAWDRGMGKYVRELFAAYTAAYGSSSITLILNKNLPLTEERAEGLRHIFPDATLTKLDLPGLTGRVAAGKRAATKTLDAYISSRWHKEPVNFLVLNLFTYDYCAAFPSKARKLLMMYDLIPLDYWQELYPIFGELFLMHLVTAYEADAIFCISEATKTAVQNRLGTDPAKLINISGGLIAAKPAATVGGVSLSGKYLLAVTADFHSKNNENLVKAFNMLNEEFGNSLSMVFTANFREDSKLKLQALSENLIFAGAVSDEELDRLYTNSDVVCYCSKAEGLGLPLFEAALYEKPAVASDIEVMKEVSKEAFYLADPENPEALYAAMRRAYTRQGWESKLSLYPQILKKFTWQRSTELFAEVLRRPVGNKKVIRRKGTVRLVMPSPAENNSQLGRQLQNAGGRLERWFNLKVYVSSGDVDSTCHPYYLRHHLKVKPLRQLKRRSRSFDSTLIYGVDDSIASVEIIRRALAHPGLILLAAKHPEKHLATLFDKDSLNAIFTASPKAADFTRLLKRVGNKVVVVQPSVAKSGYTFGEFIATLTKDK